MGRLKAVFFDLGGTLLDARSGESSLMKVVEATRLRYGLDIPSTELYWRIAVNMRRYEQAQSRRWTPIRELLAEAFDEEMARLGIRVESRDAEWFLKTNTAEYRRGSRLATGAMDILRGAKQLILHIGVLSDVDDAWASMLIENLRIRPLIDSITTSESVGVGKPNPKIFTVALRKAGCEPQEAVHAGDSLEKDVRGAKGVGMRAVHISPTPSPEADFQLKSIAELMPLLRKLTEGGL